MIYNQSSLQLQAYESLKEMILQNKLVYNTLYSETRIARELGISRTPLREALQHLSQEGYISIIPSRGFMIRQLSESSMRESIQTRCAIEGFCVHLVTSQPDDRRTLNLFKAMEKQLQLQKKALDSGSDEKFTEADHNFHLQLVHFAENEEFNQIFQRLMHMIHLTTVNAIHVSGRARASYDEHAELYRQLKDGNGDIAYRLLIAHLLMPLSMDLLRA